MSPRQLYRQVRSRVQEVRWSLDEVGMSRRLQFHRDRSSAAYQQSFDQPAPLVSAIVATYNRGPLLLERSLSSLLAQTYRNLEIIVVGDCCSDDTEARMREVADPRVRFINLPERGRYPADPKHRWMVAGSAAVNHGLAIARGDFVTHLDDDDVHPPQRVQSLLDTMRRERVDLVWHPFEFEPEPDVWKVNEALRFAFKSVTTSSIFYHRWFASIPWDMEAWRRPEPGDWNRLRKFRFLGARVHRHPELLLKHYRERNQTSK
jgi:glycosyltransferase involved in cell wall biosynthesis